MTDQPTPPVLYRASVPVFLHYLDRMAAILARMDVTPEVLAHRLAPDMAPASAQFSTAINFSLRTCLKLAGKRVSGVPQVDASREVLADWLAAARAKLAALKPEDFAESRTIQHRAGVAFLEQSGHDFLHLFGMPNFMFHYAMAYANLRAAGVPLGKADFDGLHGYPEGFVL
tara:strand:- start:52 stop:567 length:516 start_codon:yes stop_codon:yes gene_type:complete